MKSNFACSQNPCSQNPCSENPCCSVNPRCSEKSACLQRYLLLAFAFATPLVSGICIPNACAQNSSLFQLPPAEILPAPSLQGQVATVPATPESGSTIGPIVPMSHQLSAASWTYAAPAAPKVLRVHDVVSIRVDEIARMAAEGRASQRKNILYDAVLKKWVELEGLKAVRLAKQTQGSPQVNGQVNEIFRANSDLQTRESLAFNIAAEIADIRPNGNIVLEAHKSISINDNRWEISLSGMCQAKDIGPDNLVLSKDILDLKIDKRENGQARDGYRRGWFTEWANRLQPF